MINRLAEYDRPQLPPTAWLPVIGPGDPTMQRRFEALIGQASRWVVEHPEIALTGAVVTGVVFGWLIKRR